MSAILTVDLGYGDSGKGTIVDALARREENALVVRYNGGAQCAHNVVTADGTHHCFHQYGSGTLAGCDTLLGEHVRVNPQTFLQEDIDLDDVVDSWKDFPTVFVDERCVVTTPWHMALNRIRENARTQRHGSCGMGVGETVSHMLDLPYEVLRVGDIKDHDLLADKLEIIRDRMYRTASQILGTDAASVSPVFKVRNFHQVMGDMLRFSRIVRVATHESCVELVRTRNTIFEGAQGVLLDEDYGFHPYTTWSHTTLQHAEEMCIEAGVMPTSRIGIMRTYMTRHGAGPLAAEETNSTRKEPHNRFNDWQSGWRVGLPDLTAWDYALRHASKTWARGSLAVTHCDQIKEVEQVIPVRAYEIFAEKFAGEAFKDLGIRTKATEQQMKMFQETALVTANVTRDRFLSYISDSLGLPIGITSSGPTAQDKQFFAHP